MTGTVVLTPKLLDLASTVAVLRQQLDRYGALMSTAVSSQLRRVLSWSTAWVTRQDSYAPRWQRPGGCRVGRSSTTD